MIADTATTYFEIVETEEQIVLAEATAASRCEGLEIAKLRLGRWRYFCASVRTAAGASGYSCCREAASRSAGQYRSRAHRLFPVDLARALEVEQVATHDLTVQQAFREVSDALAGREYLAQQIETLERARGAQVEIARIARARYREGVADYLEVLDAERNLFSAEQQLLATHRAWLQNRAMLFVSLGGGFAREDTGG